MVVGEKIGKHIKKLVAIRELSFGVQKGETFGIIGPDGAGKTTLFRILTTLMLPDSGRATVNGFDVVRDYRKIRTMIGYMPGRFSLYLDLTVEENLKVFASVFNTSIQQNLHLIKDIYSHLEPFKTRRAGALSGGMKQKLALCCALIHKPLVLFLDEPTTGVDPVSRQEFWETLSNLKKGGMTILISTPYMDEASRCDRIGLIQQGNFLMVDTPQAITSSFKDPLIAVRADNIPKLLSDLRAHPGVNTCFAFGDTVHVRLFEQEENPVFTLKSFLETAGHTVKHVAPIKAGVEDCFMKLSNPL